MSRLKEIKELLDHVGNEANLLHQAKLKREVLNMFKEQAELVVGLEKKLNIATERGAKLAHKNVSYKQALEFYADRDNYKLEHFDPNLDDYMSTVDYDEGQKARQTIGSEKIND